MLIFIGIRENLAFGPWLW